MIKFPKLHIADETLMRIGIVAKQTRPRRRGAEQAPELVEMPSAEEPGPMMPQAPESAAMQPQGELPPLDQSGLDQGTVARGGTAFKAMTEGM